MTPPQPRVVPPRRPDDVPVATRETSTTVCPVPDCQAPVDVALTLHARTDPSGLRFDAVVSTDVAAVVAHVRAAHPDVVLR